MQQSLPAGCLFSNQERPWRSYWYRQKLNTSDYGGEISTNIVETDCAARLAARWAVQKHNLDLDCHSQHSSSVTITNKCHTLHLSWQISLLAVLKLCTYPDSSDVLLVVTAQSVHASYWHACLLSLACLHYICLMCNCSPFHNYLTELVYHITCRYQFTAYSRKKVEILSW